MKKSFSKNVIISATFEEVDRAVREIAGDISQVCDQDRAFKVAVCLTEACSNIIKHGYKFDSSKKVTIRVKASRDSIKLIIEDSSGFFNPLDAECPDLSSVRDLQDGGMGILILKRTAKTASYERKEGKNILKLTL